MNLVSLQREEELSPKSLSVESHYVPCPLFPIKTYAFPIHTVRSQSFTPALTQSSHLFIARQTMCKSRYLETFIISNILVSVNLPLGNKLFFLFYFFFFQLVGRVKESLHFARLMFSSSLILLNLIIWVTLAANKIKYTQIKHRRQN